MKKAIVILIVVVFTSLSWVNQQEKTIPDSEFEQAVFYELFPKLINTFQYDLRLYPPPPPDYLEKQGFEVKGESNSYHKAYEEWKKSADYKKRNKNWKRRKDSIEQDTSSVYFSISDFISTFKKNDKAELLKHFGDDLIIDDSFESSDGFKVDLAKLKTNRKKIKFKYVSEFLNGEDFWKAARDANINTALNFSRILFDQTKQYGVLNVGFVKGPLNGSGSRIFIKKSENGKWVIDKIVATWVS